jgi:hypothetical protein
MDCGWRKQEREKFDLKTQRAEKGALKTER